MILDVYNPNDWSTFRKTFGLDDTKGHPSRRCIRGGIAPIRALMGTTPKQFWMLSGLVLRPLAQPFRSSPAPTLLLLLAAFLQSRIY